MAYEKVEPFRAHVWFDDGPRVSARVVGVWNGFAVAEIGWGDVHRLFDVDMRE